MGTLIIHWYDTKGKQTQNTYYAQSQTQAAAIIAAAYVSGTVSRIEYRHV